MAGLRPFRPMRQDVVLDRKRHLQWPACYNTRELGGYAVGPRVRTRWGALVRSDTLSRLTAQGRATLLNYGIRTVVDLRGPSELVREPHPFSESGPPDSTPQYVNVPLRPSKEGLDASRLDELRRGPESYVLTVDTCQYAIAMVVQTFANATRGGVLMHCQAGSDRTGVIIALLLTHVGVSETSVAQDFAFSARQLKPWFEQQRRQIRVPIQFGTPISTSPPSWILSLLAHIRTTYGDVTTYLRICGVSDADLERVVTRLCETQPTI